MGMDFEPDKVDVDEKIEAFIIELGFPFDEVQDDLWVIHDDIDFIENIVVYHNNPVLTFRIKLMEAPEEAVRPSLYKRLLQLNATSMVAGAFGLENEDVVIVESLQSETMTQGEFQAAFDSITLAVREHYQDLKSFVRSGDDDENQKPEAAVEATNDN